jgi:hypothetical protein
MGVCTVGPCPARRGCPRLPPSSAGSLGRNQPLNGAMATPVLNPSDFRSAGAPPGGAIREQGYVELFMQVEAVNSSSLIP